MRTETEVFLGSNYTEYLTKHCSTCSLSNHNVNRTCKWYISLTQTKIKSTEPTSTDFTFVLFNGAISFKYYTVSDVDKARRPRGTVAQKYRLLKSVMRFFRTGFHSSDRRQYSGSLLRDLGITSVIIIGGPRLLSPGAPNIIRWRIHTSVAQEHDYPNVRHSEAFVTIGHSVRFQSSFWRPEQGSRNTLSLTIW
jgi:hypothetical protein